MPPARLLVIACVIAPMAARADGEQAVSVEAGWATFSTVGKKVGTMEPPALSPDIGGTIAVMYEREVSTDLSLRAEGAGAVFSGGNQKKQTSTSYAGIADVGGIVSGGGPIDHGTDFVVVLGGGLDWLQSRTCSTGFDARLASFGGNITVFTVGLRGTVRWGYF